MFQWIHKLINCLRIKKNKKKIISSLSYGDIIWCDVKQYKDVKFKKGHSLRPYFFMEFMHNKIRAIPLTHNVEKHKYVFYINEQVGSMILVNGYFDLPIKTFKNTFSKTKLTPEEISRITKRILLRYCNTSEIYKYKAYIILSAGDLVSYKNAMYFVAEASIDEIILYPYTKHNKEDWVHLGRKFYFKNEPIHLKSKKDLVYIASKEFSFVLKLREYIRAEELRKRELKKKKQKKNKNSTIVHNTPMDYIGCLVNYKDSQYYIYDMDGETVSLISRSFVYNEVTDIKNVTIVSSKKKLKNEELIYARNLFS